jgi:hypothetical protein
VISALCAGIVFRFAAITVSAQDYHQPYAQPYSQPYPQSYSQPYTRPSLSSRAASNGGAMDNALEGSADTAKIFRDIADARTKAIARATGQSPFVRPADGALLFSISCEATASIRQPHARRPIIC